MQWTQVENSSAGLYYSNNNKYMIEEDSRGEWMVHRSCLDDGSYSYRYLGSFSNFDSALRFAESYESRREHTMTDQQQQAKARLNIAVLKAIDTLGQEETWKILKDFADALERAIAKDRKGMYQ